MITMNGGHGHWCDCEAAKRSMGGFFTGELDEEDDYLSGHFVTYAEVIGAVQASYALNVIADVEMSSLYDSCSVLVQFYLRDHVLLMDYSR